MNLFVKEANRQATLFAFFATISFFVFEVCLLLVVLDKAVIFSTILLTLAFLAGLVALIVQVSINRVAGIQHGSRFGLVILNLLLTLLLAPIMAPISILSLLAGLLVKR